MASERGGDKMRREEQQTDNDTTDSTALQEIM